jgi:hypothetical protein
VVRAYYDKVWSGLDMQVPAVQQEAA